MPRFTVCAIIPREKENAALTTILTTKSTHTGGNDGLGRTEYIKDRAVRTPADGIPSNSKTGRDESPSGVQIPPLSATQSLSLWIPCSNRRNSPRLRHIHMFGGTGAVGFSAVRAQDAGEVSVCR
jgi:hypothetical protein